MSVVTEISFLRDKVTPQTTTNAQVGRRASDFVQVGITTGIGSAPRPRRTRNHARFSFLIRGTDIEIPLDRGLGVIRPSIPDSRHSFYLVGRNEFRGSLLRFGRWWQWESTVTRRIGGQRYQLGHSLW